MAVKAASKTVEKEETREIATASVVEIANALPTELEELCADDAGKGVSSRPEDNTIPFVKILQSNSPQVKRNEVQYIDGASESDILLGGVNLVAPGDGGIIVQPVYFEQKWVEWKPDSSARSMSSRIRTCQ